MSAITFVLLSLLVINSFAQGNSDKNKNASILLKNLPVTGTYDGGEFSGDVTINQFSYLDDTLMVSGVLKAFVDNKRVNQKFSNAPALLSSGAKRSLQQADCPILDLEIGPIFLDVLGLQVFIDPINIEIIADPGPGNLLGMFNSLSILYNFCRQPVMRCCWIVGQYRWWKLPATNIICYS